MLNWLWPKRSGHRASAAGLVESVELRHLDGVVADQVRAFFAGELPRLKLDEGRSVRIAHPLKEGLEIKIKGTGFKGGSIQFGTRRNTGPKAPLFDYDGRMMEDVASGHAMIITLGFAAAPALAGDAPKTKADCEKAGMKWDDASQSCSKGY